MAALISPARIPIWALRFNVYGLVGKSRFGDGDLRVLYAGTEPFFDYFKSLVFAQQPEAEFFGKYTILELSRARQGRSWDIELYRSHKQFADLGLFPTGFFVPEWLSGTSDLTQQKTIEATSKSRKRDRNLLCRNSIGYEVTTKRQDLDYFYQEMYLPHMLEKHGESVVLMTKEQMMSRVRDDHGELVMIQLGDQAVGGSLVFREQGRPRLYSQGVLHNDKDLLRSGVGTAIYLYSFEHAAKSGFDEIHMGWSRAFLAKGSLHFKQRFGLRLDEISAIGHFLKLGNPSTTAKECLRNLGAVHYRSGY